MLATSAVTAQLGNLECVTANTRANRGAWGIEKVVAFSYKQIRSLRILLRGLIGTVTKPFHERLGIKGKAPVLHIQDAVE